MVSIASLRVQPFALMKKGSRPPSDLDAVKLPGSPTCPDEEGMAGVGRLVWTLPEGGAVEARHVGRAILLAALVLTILSLF
jgi:hypothetical protein